MFYELSGVIGKSLNSTDPCHQFNVNPVPGTSLLLLGIPSGNVHHCTNRSVAPGQVCITIGNDVACVCAYVFHSNPSSEKQAILIFKKEIIKVWKAQQLGKLVGNVLLLRMEFSMQSVVIPYFLFFEVFNWNGCFCNFVFFHKVNKVI